MYRYDNYTDSFVRIDGEPNTGSTTVRVGVPLKGTAVTIKKVELTDECIEKIADAVVRKLADRKTENCSEKPNNCETCRFELYCPEMCEGCCEWDSHYEPKTEPTISKMEQVETMSCQECKRWIYDDRWGWFCPLKSQDECKYEPKDEPKIYKINPQEPTNDDKCFECDDFFTCGGQCNKIEDEPQTDCPKSCPSIDICTKDDTDCPWR